MELATCGTPLPTQLAPGHYRSSSFALATACVFALSKEEAEEQAIRPRDVPNNLRIQQRGGLLHTLCIEPIVSIRARFWREGRERKIRL
jgi:hypothetical protein